MLPLGLLSFASTSTFAENDTGTINYCEGMQIKFTNHDLDRPIKLDKFEVPDSQKGGLTPESAAMMGEEIQKGNTLVLTGQINPETGHSPEVKVKLKYVPNNDKNEHAFWMLVKGHNDVNSEKCSVSVEKSDGTFEAPEIIIDTKGHSGTPNNPARGDTTIKSFDHGL